MKLKEVKYVTDYTLHVKFEDGVEGDIELGDLVENGIFNVLQNKELFSKAYNTGYSIAWSEELEIDSDAIYFEVSGKKMEDVMLFRTAYASN
ncbi:MAG: DUF2442 domain-containing protein [Chitinophagaceae bacterium]|nr:DUF2442 domain-containing protein [Chitinophagaceae bacterium]